MFSERWALVALIALSTLIMGFLSLLAWRRRQSPLGRVFFLFTLLGSFYTFGYMCELASNTLAAIRFWLRIESVGIAFLPTAWVTLAVRHTGIQNRRWPQLQAVLLMLSTITFILSNTSEFHHLHYGPLRLNPEAPFPVVTFVPGPWYWIHTAFINLAILFGNILYARVWLKSSSDKSQQAFTIFLGSLFPWVVYIIYLLKLIPWGIDPNPIAFLVPGILYAWATFNLNMLEITPIARQAVFQRLSDGVLVFDREGCLADFNAAGSRAFPELRGGTKGKAGIRLFCEYPAMMNILAGPTDEQSTIWLEPDGGKINFQLQRIELYDRKGSVAGFMVLLRDITHFSAIMEGLQLQATIDPLTKAWNRYRWQADGEALLSQARWQQGVISLIIMDMDNFKLINDTHGHRSGDAVLAQFALTCQQNLRVQDIFGRYGGDEFVIILPGMNRSGAVELAERLKRAVESMTVEAGEKKIKITASFGVVTEQQGSTVHLEEIIEKADQALYKAKKAGGNGVCILDNSNKAK
ncbi:nucleotide cyclase [Lucifera butyrica]|uniref:Nucleotide cyclase n=1 Tax=Lucifera butyrica TaxID=1351585 RepID=A0A498R7C4_9FIRM|nr:histidine kinase N-terminal 7TM domain-containing protein [Lucifera butyrica]VBB08656.1 nucleotide cyclase [Lucifera butyrica]